jgi:hypothetical protein
VASAVFLLVLAWAAVAYLLAPALWSRYARRHPSLADVPGITHTGSGIPGDPVNVALFGTKAELVRAASAAGWHPADPLSLRSSLGIVETTLLRRAYENAPVSNLYLYGRKEDLAFERPAGRSPRERHHVRFWQTDKADADGRPVWVGSATYDRSVGLSHTTGQVTHHIAADVDAERDGLVRDLERAGTLSEAYAVADFHPVRAGRNGGGDPWHTDGALLVGVIAVNPGP